MYGLRSSALTLAIPLFAASPAMAAISVNCTAGTLSGLYTYHTNGFTIVGGASVPVSSAGYSFYNADGTSQGKVTTVAQVKAKTVTTVTTFTATYKVAANCTIKEIDKDEHGVLTHYDEFTTPTGSTIQFIETDPGVVSSGVATRD